MTDVAAKTVFVSYASADAEIVREIVAGLEARGVRCWFAERDIPVADDFGDRIMAAIAASDATVVVLSESSVNSRHVRREINFADGEGHLFYPVRLLDILVSRELAYFTKVGRWIDLHDESRAAAMDRLAEAIRDGRELERRRGRRERWWGRLLAFGLVALIALAAAVSLWQFRAVEGRLGDLAARNSGDERYGQAGFNFWRDPEADGFRLSHLERVETQLYGIPWQDEPVELGAYDDSGDGLRRIARSQAVPVRDQMAQSMALDFIDLAEDPLLCLIFSGRDADGEPARFAAVGHYLQVEFDPDSGVTQVSEDATCDSHLNVDPGDFAARLAEEQEAHAIEQATPYAAVSQAVGREEFPPSVQFVVLGGWDLATRVPGRQSTARVFLGRAGGIWNPAVEAPPASAHFARDLTIPRPVPETHLRACAAQPLADGRWIVSDVMFRRDDRTELGWRRLTEARAGEAIVTGADPCDGIAGTTVPHETASAAEPGARTDSADATSVMPEDTAPPVARTAPLDNEPSADEARTEVGEDAAQSPGPAAFSDLDWMIGPGTGDVGFGTRDRADALAAIAAGEARPYGPAVAGLRLGMAMEDAIARAELLLPGATRLDTAVSPYYGSSYADVRSLVFVDVVRQLSLTLTSHDGRDILAGAWWHQMPQSQPIPINEGVRALRDRLGEDRAAQRKDYPSQKELVWLDPAIGDCNFGPVPFTTHAFDPRSRARFPIYIDLVTAQGASHLQSCGTAVIAYLRSDQRAAAQTVALSDYDALIQIGGASP